MILTEGQRKGLDIAVARYKNKEPYTCIAGYAGTGKSTLIKFIISALDLDEESVAYVAFTGKAAKVLSSKGCPNATTAHKLLYKTITKSDGSYYFVKKDKLNEDYKLIVVDEVSMLPKEMWDLLLSHHVYVLAAGDPEQLPPIRSADDNHILDAPHIFLSEIMRQAFDSEIIRLSMHVREGKPLNTFHTTGEEVKLISKREIVSGMYTWADIIICATNQTRITVNDVVRNMKGFTDEPQIGDSVINLKNEWEILSTKGTALTNGTIGTITYIFKDEMLIPARIYPERKFPYLMTNIETDDGEIFNNLIIDYNGLVLGEKSLTPAQEYKMQRNTRSPDPPLQFNYGYAITAHRAQGSEWNKILIFEEDFPHDRDTHRRWLYTALTRSKTRAVIVKND